MRSRFVLLAGLSGIFALLLGVARTAAARPQLHDYLSPEEASKIRNSPDPGDRIKLYMSFAEDRLDKFNYELNRTAPERDRSDVLNGLLHAYEGCMDDASDEKEALKLMDAKGKSFLSRLQKYSKTGRYLSDYSDTLQDAIDSTNDALSDVADARKNMLPAVVRRKQ
jgi:hypothetical protein